jgi:N-terminal acetyltransferase B complex non-catalytic subunit
MVDFLGFFNSFIGERVYLRIFFPLSNPRKATPAELRRAINVHKLQRYNISKSQLTVESESARASLYLKDYLQGLKLGEHLPKTELQPADDLAILIGQTFVSLWKLTGSEGPLCKAVVVLEFASAKSIHSFQIRLLLIRIYRLLGKFFQPC